MAKFGLNLNALLEECKTENGYDFDKAQTKLQSQVDGYLTKQEPELMELRKQNEKLLNDTTALSSKYNEVLTNSKQLENELTGFKRSGIISSKGFQPKYNKAVTLEAESRVTDTIDFESALDLVKQDFPEFLGKQSKGTTTPTGNTTSADEDLNAMRASMGL